MPSFFNSWLPFIYLYGIGGAFFLFGLIILRKSNALDMTIKKHRVWYKIMIGGYFYFFLIHAILIISALYL